MSARLPLVVLILCLLAPLTASAVTLKIATIAPNGTGWMNAMRAGAKEVKERTEGRVKLRFYPGGVMGSDKSVLRKMRIGQLQGGALTGGGLAMVYPNANIYSLPFSFRNYDEVDYVRSKMDPLLMQQLEDKGFVSFGFIETGFAYLMSKEPIRSVSDLENRKIWIPEGDKISQAAFEAVGVSPIQLPLTDVMTGLQTGLIDTVGSSPVGAIALQWHTRLHYITDLPVMYLYGTLVVQERALRRIQPEDRKILNEVMSKAAAELDEQARKDNRGAKKALVAQGLKLLEPSASQAKRWRTNIDDAVAKLTQEGVFTKAMLERLEGNLAEYREHHGQP